MITRFQNIAFTISECAIVRNIIQFTSIFPFISWCYGAANIRWTPWVYHSSWYSVEVNCAPESSEINCKYHQQNSSVFPNLDWNVSNSSITCSVAITKWQIAYFPLYPVADYVHMLDFNTWLHVGSKTLPNLKFKYKFQTQIATSNLNFKKLKYSPSSRVNRDYGKLTPRVKGMK